MDNKLIAVAAGAAVLAVAVGYGIYHCVTNGPKWDADKADATKASLDDLYAASMAEFPNDATKASFHFELAANEAKHAFKADNGTYPEYLDWEKEYIDQVDQLLRTIRKGK